MVGVPGKSKGCNTCRRRKKGCDQRRPICGQCEFSGYHCGGYNRDRSFVIHPATNAVRRAVFLPYVAPNPLSLLQSLNRNALDSQCRGLFWQFYMPRGDCMCRDQFILQYGHPMNWAELVRSLPHEDTSLSDAFSALSISGAARGNNDARLINESTRLYGKALKELQLALYDPAKMRSDQTLMACMLLGLYEMLQEPSPTSPRWLAHAQGAARLIQLRGPALHREWDAHHSFLASRVPTLYAAILSRQATYLAHQSWLTVPWEKQLRTYFDRLVDAAVHIPGHLETLDLLQDSPTTNTARLLHLLKKCADLQTQLNQWRDGTKPSAVPVAVKHGAFDPHSYPFDTDLWFANHLFAHARMFYCTCSLTLAEAALEIIRLLTTAQESLGVDKTANKSLSTLFDPEPHARDICRIVSYCTQRDMGALGPILVEFPTTVARQYYQRIKRTEAIQWLDSTLADVRARVLYAHESMSKSSPASTNSQGGDGEHTVEEESDIFPRDELKAAPRLTLTDTAHSPLTGSTAGIFVREDPSIYYQVVGSDNT
ncbi:hypothetical protein B0A52_10150 [Exophiala mesophila]|uniref:Zn(2)-C6 fungal-type domain-containing protein n=1 Tax=Exophiala mesophila TaxID=212818 RepID=A0A438MRG4_EXOME|nr:hypothetical protein B0A52_10150 [Exophiala mesophila]